MKSDLSFLPKLSKLVLFLGGANVELQIEGWFKTAKHRFGLHRFGQGTLLGVYRWFVLSLISYVLAHWAYLATAIAPAYLPDWGEAAEIARTYYISSFGSVTSFTRY